MKITGAFQTVDWLRLDTDQGKLMSQTKRTILEAGVVFTVMPDGTEPAWTVECPLIGGGTAQLRGGVIDPVALVLARQRYDALNRPGFLAGVMKVPSRVEATDLLLERGMPGWPRPMVKFSTQT